MGFALPRAAAVVRKLLPSQRFELAVWTGSGIPTRFGRFSWGIPDPSECRLKRRRAHGGVISGSVSED